MKRLFLALICIAVILPSETLAETLSGKWMVYGPKGTHYADLTMEQAGNSVTGELNLFNKGAKVPVTGVLEGKQLTLKLELCRDIDIAKKVMSKAQTGVLELLVELKAFELFVFPDVDAQSKSLAEGKFFSFWIECGKQATGLFSEKYVLKEFYNAGEPKAAEKRGDPKGSYTLKRAEH